METYYKVLTYVYSANKVIESNFNDYEIALQCFCALVLKYLKSSDNLRFELIEYNWDKPCPCTLKKVELYNNKEGKC